MNKLTKYSNFSDLKAEKNLTNNAQSNSSKIMEEYKTFIEQLRETAPVISHSYKLEAVLGNGH